MTEPLTLLCRALKIGALVALLVLPATAFAEDAARRRHRRRRTGDCRRAERQGAACRCGDARRRAAPCLPRSPNTARALPGSMFPTPPRPACFRSATARARHSPAFSTSPIRASRKTPSGRSPSCSTAVRARRRPICISARIGPKAIEANAKGELARSPVPPRRQRFELARLHRSRVRRSGRHRL